MAPKTNSAVTAPKRRAAPKKSGGTASRKRAPSRARSTTAQKRASAPKRAAPAKKRATSRATSDGAALKKAAQKRLDALGDGVDQLTKIAERLSAQVKEMAASVADARDSTSKGKKKKKKSK